MAILFTAKLPATRPKVRRVSTEDRVRSAAIRNTELLQLLACTDSAKPAFKQKEDYVHQLERALTKNAEEVKRLTAARESEEKEYHHHHDSMMKRLALRISGKGAKEDKQHFDARKSLLIGLAMRLELLLSSSVAIAFCLGD